MRTSSGKQALVFLVLGAGAALLAAGCGSSNSSKPGTDSGTDGASSSSSSGSSSGTSSGGSSGEDGGEDGGDGGTASSSSGGGDAGDAGCVFQTLVTGIITNPPATPVPCGTPLCGCTDNGMLITKVQGSF